MEYNDADEEYEAVAAFAKSHPFPSKEELFLKIRDRRDKFGLYLLMILMGLPEDQYRPCIGAGLDLSCYDDGNYKDMKLIYDSGFDPKITRICGQRIANRGEEREPGYALEEMRGIAYIMRDYSPLASAKDPTVRMVGTTRLNHLWDGIRTPAGVWMA